MPTLKSRLRLATQQDLNAVTALVNSAYRGDSSRVGWTTEADVLDGTRTAPHLLKPHVEQKHLWVFEDESSSSNQEPALLACFLLEPHPPLADIGMLTVRPDLQNQGLGRRLLEAAEELSRNSGCHRLRLSVVETRSELRDYYMRRGFLDTGQRIPFPSSDPAFGQPRQTLHLATMEKRLEASI